MAIEAGTRFFVVPHTHWDREWYGPFEHFQLQARGGRRRGARRARARPELHRPSRSTGRRSCSRTTSRSGPRTRRRLRALLAAGRIEIGPSYMLPDEFLVGAEPLVRNLLIGRAVCRRFGAEPSPVGYLPDSFGHPLQLPQILAGFGIESFIFSRGMGDELDEVGVVFRWRAPDGSEVLAFQLLADYGNFASCPGRGRRAERGSGESSSASARCSTGPASERAAVQRHRPRAVRARAAGAVHRARARGSPERVSQIAELRRLRGGGRRRRSARVVGRAPRQPAPERAPRRQLRAAVRQAGQRARRAAAARGRDARARCGRCATASAFPHGRFHARVARAAPLPAPRHDLRLLV